MTRHPFRQPTNGLCRQVCWPVALMFMCMAGLGQSATADDVTKPATTATTAKKTIEFARDVEPILSQHCYDCHGPETQEGDLRLDGRPALLRGGTSGEPAVVPGKGEHSQLILLVSGAEPDRMMPADGDPLTPKQIALLRAWIDQGAVWPESHVGDDAQETPGSDFWSFQPLKPMQTPTDRHVRVSNPIDAYVLRKLNSTSLSPSKPASRRHLVRRLYFDLLGLPPSPAEVEAFRADQRPDAYSRLVDRLLANPHYGERWARHWLDVVRFAETDGFETNIERPTAFRYRDYVIAAFNEDMPFDRFISEQLAGDATGVDAGTGFLVGGTYDRVKSPDIALTLMQRQNELADMVGATGTTFLGLTVGCARCHNHKFDPVQQKDYYALQAVFAGVRHGERPLNGPSLKSYQRRMSEIENEIARVDSTLSELGLAVASQSKPSVDGGQQSKSATASSSTDELPTVSTESPNQSTSVVAFRPDQQKQADALLTQRADLLQRKKEFAKTQPMVYAGKFEQPEATHRLYRGDPLTPREAVVADAIAFLGSLELEPETPEQERRIALARWIRDPENPLTARVLVNRLWQYHFGRGIVDTPSDFGRNGGRPTHPDLLDWLAVEFIRSGWSIKHVQRLILLSSTYQQAAVPREDALAVDADSRLLWRYPPRRLEAESIRDSILAVSGSLRSSMGGAGFSLFQPNDNYVRVYAHKEEFGPAEWRRMVYMTKVRMEHDAVFGAFDCPDAGQASPTRSLSTTSIQALNLFNSGFVMQQSQLFADRLTRETNTSSRNAGGTVAAQVARAFELTFGREPDADELVAAVRLIDEHGLAAFCRALFNTNEFLLIP